MLKTKFDEGKRYRFATHINDILLPREEAEVIEAFKVVIEPGQYTHRHVHPEAEQLYYVRSGRGRAVYTLADGETREFELEPEDVVHVPRHTYHQIFCTSEDEPLVYLCIDGFPEGIPADEPTWDSHAQAIYAAQKK